MPMTENNGLYSEVVGVRCRECDGSLESTGCASEREHVWKSYVCNHCDKGGVVYIDYPGDDEHIITTGIVKLTGY